MQAEMTYGQVFPSGTYYPIFNRVSYFDNTSTPTIGSTGLYYEPASNKFIIHDALTPTSSVRRLDLDNEGLGFYNDDLTNSHYLSSARLDFYSKHINNNYPLPPWDWGLTIKATNENGQARDAMFFKYDGSIGIGNSKPKAQVHLWNDPNSADHDYNLNSGVSETFLVGPYNFDFYQGQGAIKTSGEGGGFYFMDRNKTADINTSGGSASAGDWWIWASTAGTASLWTPQTQNTISVMPSGNVGIGILSPSEKLVVDGKICAREIRVSLLSDPCDIPDYVFEKDYKLMPLSEVKKYVDKNKHLPEIADAQTIAKNGVQLGELNLQLLKKIEELTLYMIELEKQVKTLQANQNKGGK